MKPIIPICIALLTTGGIATAQHIEADLDERSTAVENEDDEPAASDDEPVSDDESVSDDEATLADEAASQDEDSDEPAAGEESATEPAAEEEPLTEDETTLDAGDTTDAGVTDLIEEQPTPPEPGMAVRLERVQTGTGSIDPASVKLRAPFPAKLLAQVPDGWSIEKSPRAPAFTREVELAPGSAITLTVEPHILIPNADGSHVFAVNEPGYTADLGYRQNTTVGAILATSIRQLEDDSRQLGTAIDQLQQLLVSLPQQEPPPQDDNPAPKRKR